MSAIPLLGITETVKVRITKLQEPEDAKHKNNIPVGDTREGYVAANQLRATIGVPYFVYYEEGDRAFRTSTVREVIDDTTFRTNNSIYQVTVLEDQA